MRLDKQKVAVVYFLTIWMTSSSFIMCCSPTRWGLYFVLVPYNHKTRGRSHICTRPWGKDDLDYHLLGGNHAKYVAL